MNDKTYRLDFAERLDNELITSLAPQTTDRACRMIEIAGSIRRKKEEVHDIDLVAWPVYDSHVQTGLFGSEVVNDGPTRLVRALSILYANPGDIKPDARIIKFEWDLNIPVEIYLCEPDGNNFNALLQMRTGSAGHNAWLAKRALDQHKKYRAGYGIFDASMTRRLDDGSETGIYRALGLRYIEPEAR